jgi:type I restriction enzyme S subunit
MKAVLEKIDLNNLDKSTWESFRFEEITNRVSETVDPNTTNLKTYVGLEHIDAENIHIKRFGTPNDVSGGKLKCYPGDVIFGKRRAYQRKAAIVEFEGICSAHAFVFRPNPKVIDPKLFPFFLHSDQFMHRAVDISVGGLSPTINWGDLKGQEFLLPPKTEQGRLTELLWSMDALIEKEKQLLDKIIEFKEVRMINLLNGYNLEKDKSKLPSGWKLLKLKDLGTVSTSSVDKKNNRDEKEINLLNYMDVYSSLDKKIDSRINFMRVTANDNQLSKNQIFVGDILFTPSSETANDIGHSAVVTEDLPDTLHSYHLVRLRFSIEIDLEFKRFLFNNPKILYYFTRRAKGVTRMILGLDDFNETELRIPPLNKQKEIAKELSTIYDLISNIKSNIIVSQSLQKSLIKQIF